MEASLPNLVEKLQASLETACTSVPECEKASATRDGLSLLSAKNELFATYLQNLTFLILCKLRRLSTTSNVNQEDDIGEVVLNKLIEARVYIERGVQPLEGRLRYQIDKVLRSQENANRKIKRARDQTNGTNGQAVKEARQSSLEDMSNESESEDDLAYRPNLSAFTGTAKNAEGARKPDINLQSGVYKPPRLAPMAPPTTDGRSITKRPHRSAALEEYITSEISAAPLNEPSIGSTIALGGQGYKSEKDRRKDEERRAYEEANFVRLPGETKKERARNKGLNETSNRFGGENFNDMDARLRRISSSVSRGGSSRSSRNAKHHRPTKRRKI